MPREEQPTYSLAAWVTKARRGLERLGRGLLIVIVGLILGVHRRAVLVAQRPRILVVRLDERIGNLVLLTPLLSSLRARFVDAEIDLLAHHRGAALLAGHPAITRFVPFDKRRLLAEHGPVRAPLALRRRKYDIAIDAANPTDPSTTQALMVALSGARHTIGFDCGGFGRFYSAPVRVTNVVHEIDMRLQLLTALPGDLIERRTSIAPLSAASIVRSTYGLLNVGARLGEKRLDVAAYAALARAIQHVGLVCQIAYGPGERELALAIGEQVPEAQMTPPTSLVELAKLMRDAHVVVSCDTGPMHIAAATGTPTCGLFVCTPPARYGYTDAPHAAIDTRGRAVLDWLSEVDQWLAASTTNVEERRSPGDTQVQE